MGEGPNPNGKHSKYSIEDGKLIRKETCPEPNCGPGVFLAVHKDRKSCGKCGYTVKNEKSKNHSRSHHLSRPCLQQSQRLVDL